MKWYFKVLGQYADFSGRARRKELWMFVLFNVIFVLVASFIDGLVSGIMGFREPIYVCSIIYSFSVLLPTLAVYVRRLHDTGRSAWWLLISLIPVIGGIWLLVLLVQDGEYNSNPYGSNPKTLPQKPTEKARLKSTAITIIFAAAFGIVSVLSILREGLPHIIGIVQPLLFLTIGLLLFPKKSFNGLSLSEIRRRISTITIIYAAILTLMRILTIFYQYYDVFLYQYYGIFFYQYYDVFLDNSVMYTYILLDFVLLFFAIALTTSNEKLHKTSSSLLILISAVTIVVRIIPCYNRIGVSSDFFNDFFHIPIFEISLILLATVFMPRKEGEVFLLDNPIEGSEQTSFSPKTFGESEYQPSNDYALLHIYRPGYMKGAFISYKLHLGERVIFKAKYKSKITVKVTTDGLQTLWARTEARKKLPIDIQFGNEYYIRCSLRMGILIGRPKIELVNHQTGKIEFDKI